jgi:hypothetical protein
MVASLPPFEIFSSYITFKYPVRTYLHQIHFLEQSRVLLPTSCLSYSISLVSEKPCTTLTFYHACCDSLGVLHLQELLVVRQPCILFELPAPKMQAMHTILGPATSET